MNILTVNLLLSTMIFWIAARIYLLPKLPNLRPQAVLLPILILHSLRHLGLMFLAPGAIYAGLPPRFAYPAVLPATVEIPAIPGLNTIPARRSYDVRAAEFSPPLLG